MVEGVRLKFLWKGFLSGGRAHTQEFNPTLSICSESEAVSKLHKIQWRYTSPSVRDFIQSFVDFCLLYLPVWFHMVNTFRVTFEP